MSRGFSLIEVVVALFILSTSIIVLYNLILSTNVSIFNLQDHYLSKEVANNRIALIHSIERPSLNSYRDGYMEMGGKTWEWQENFKEGDTKDFIQYEILIKLKDSERYIYRTEGFIVNE
ncbi:type II secretion system minor pseudopilin GspI [Gammaproteobacteria bacterium]|nr:type II secretion system minor pseudopilin GspI [Gammaproteobacteria bacterium]